MNERKCDGESVIEKAEWMRDYAAQWGWADLGEDAETLYQAYAGRCADFGDGECPWWPLCEA